MERAVEAAIWGMPIVSVNAMRQPFFRDAGAKYGDILYLTKRADWRLDHHAECVVAPYSPSSARRRPSSTSMARSTREFSTIVHQPAYVSAASPLVKRGPSQRRA